MPTAETVEKVLVEIAKNAANYRYFFEKLSSPAWLQPLADRGLFRTPPPKEEVDGGVRFPAWPASQYLSRMAKLPAAQAQVAKIARDMGDTDNISVHHDLLEIALALPAIETASFAKKAGQWAQTPYHSVVQYHIGELIAHLANGGQAKAAFTLANATFGLRPAPTVEAGDEAFPRTPEPQAWLDDWHYDRALTQALPALEQCNHAGTIAFLCDLLNTAMEYSRNTNENEHEDFSTIWHEAIEEDHHPAQLRNTILSALRDSTRRAIEKDQNQLLPVLDQLTKYPWTVFQRIKLHLLAEFPEAGREVLPPIVSELASLESSTRHEAARLLKRVFKDQSTEIQEQILRTIDAGPNKEDVVSWLRFTGAEPTPEDITEYGTRWRAERFSLLRDHIPAAWKDRVDDVLGTTGVVRNLIEPNRTTTWVGPTSPQSAESLRALGPDGIIRYLRDWAPTRGPFEATPEGLGRVLADLIAADAASYAERANLFIGLDPTYVRTLFSGLVTACRNKTAFAWEPVLRLADWVVQQPREIADRKKALMEADPDWGWTRGTIADLLGQGVQDGPTQVPFGEREAVWRVLSVLLTDPDPTPDHEARYGGDNMEPSTMSINSVRGKAFHALIQYSLWVRRATDQQQPRIAPASMAEMLEVRDALDAHLDDVQDPALTIRSVYGQYFPWLQLLDQAWAERATATIFPDAPEKVAYWRAAWESYLLHCQPYDEVFPVLRPQYERAVRELPSYLEDAKRPGDPANRLGDHLMRLYMRGILTIEGDDQLIKEFFRGANDEVRSHALTQVGRWVKNAPPPGIKQEVISRLRALWEWRMNEVAKAQGPGDSLKEMAGFGWWFSSGAFADEWTLPQLEAALAISGGTVPDFEVIERLAAMATKYPLECVRILTHIVDGDKQGWTLYGNRDHVMNLLRAALASEHLDARKRAADVIENLIARGFFEYRSLVTPT